MQVIAGADISRRRRGPFLSSVEILVLAGMVAVLLWFLFPGRNYDNPYLLARPDHLSIAYLNMLLRAHPEDAQARLLLAQQEMALGELDQARKSLDLVMAVNKPEFTAKAEVVALKLDRQRMVAMLPGQPGREELAAQVRKAAYKMIPKTERPEDLADLADFVLGEGDPATAAKVYLRLSDLDRKNHISWLQQAARWTEASGGPGAAARLYAQAALATTDNGLGGKLGREALRALRAANEGKPAMALVRPIVERFPDDMVLLEQAIHMAVAARDLSSARQWAERRVQLAGGSEQALRDQMDILTKAGDPEGALRVAKQLLAKSPGNSQLRRQCAQLARWSGRAEESMEHWAWLAKRGSEDARQKALELARALGDNGLEVEMLTIRVNQARRMAAPTVPEFEALRKKIKPKPAPTMQPRVAVVPAARRRPGGVLGGLQVRTTDSGTLKGFRTSRALAPAGEARLRQRDLADGTDGSRFLALAQDKVPAPVTTPGPPKPKENEAKRGTQAFELGELVALADALEAKGLPERAVSAMDSFRFNFKDNPDYWSRLARLYENVGELERALACHEQLARLKAMSLDDGIRQARLLWRLQRPDAALTRLVALQGQARDTDQNYWLLLGDLAWRLENDLISTDTYGRLWRLQKTADVGERLWRSLLSMGRRDEAMKVAEEAYDKLGSPGFLVTAVDLAAKSNDWSKIRSLFRKADGKDSLFAKESMFWFQRAQLAVQDDRASDAEKYFQRVLAIDTRSEDAHSEWLTLAVHVQDRSMARRALDHWGPEVEKDRDAWFLLSDAYLLLGDNVKSARFRKLARDARARDRAMSGRPLTPEEQIEEAIEKRDKLQIESRLRAHGPALPLPIRVAALRELGRDEDAWALLEAAGMTEDKRLIGSEDASALVADVRDLRENYLSGAWAWGQSRQFGPLDIRAAGGRIELRKRRLLVGLEGEAGDLWAGTRQTLLTNGNREQRAHLIAKLRAPFGETSLRAGAEFLPEGYRPSLTLGQFVSVSQGRFEMKLEGTFGELPTHSPLLRVAGLRDGFDADVLIGLTKSKSVELGLSTSMSRFVTRNRAPLTTEVSGRGELAFRLPVGSAFFRPRLDVFRNLAPALTDIPVDLSPFLLAADTAPEDVLALQFSSVGVGLTLGSTHADVGEARGPHISLRYHLDAWAGHLWPTKKMSYAAEAGLGLVFARHQEIAVTGYYFTDVGSAAGDRYAGASLNYTLRWFR
jgi:tetratricopeptide (TPR) repeat protein